jgi:hypothetical protein
LIRDAYAKTPLGDIMILDGMNPVKRWDGLLPAPVDAGLIAPSAPCTITKGSSAGQILGYFRAYVRYVDSRGNVSILSPISNTELCESLGGLVTNATNTSPIRITTAAAHGLVSGDNVRIEGTTGNTGCIATWEITVVDGTNFDLNFSAGDGFYTGGGTWQAGVDTIEYSNVPVPTDPKVVRRQILRNTDGQFTTFYVDVDTTDLASTSFSSDNTDEDISAGQPVPLLTKEGLPFADANYPPPNFMTSMAHHQGRMFAGVNRVYRDGCVAVANGSTSVTGLGTQWTTALAGRFLFIDGASRAYEIESVEGPLALTLVDAFADATVDYAFYAIRPEIAQRRLIWWTQAGLPESWSPIYAFEVQEDGGELTGVMVKGSFDYIVSEDRIFRHTFQSDPAVDGQLYPSCQRGCVNQNCWVHVEEQTFMLDRAGIHAFSGGQESEQISTPIQNIFQVLEKNKYLINWNAREAFHAAYYPDEETIRWFVSFGSRKRPRHAITLHYRQQRWVLEEYPFAITSSAQALVAQARVVFVGSEGERTFATGQGRLDGIDARAGTMFGSVASAGLCTLTDVRAEFPACAGLAVSISSGKGAGQRRIIHAVDGQTLRLVQPWRIVPDETSLYQIAGVHYRYRSAHLTWGEDAGVEGDRSLGVFFEPSRVPSFARIKIYQDCRDSPIVWRSDTFGEEGSSAEAGSEELEIDMTNVNAYAQQRMESRRDTNIQGVRQWAFDLAGVAGNEGMRITGFVIDGAA